MPDDLVIKKTVKFHKLRLAKKKLLTSNSFFLGFDIPKDLTIFFQYKSGQYSAIKLGNEYKDFSYVSAPHELQLCFGIKIGTKYSFANKLYETLSKGDLVEVSEPQGRFIIKSHPNEKRTILAFASGIGITPIFSHIKNILYKEPKTRFFLFYVNRYKDSVTFEKELKTLQNKYTDRFYPFFSFHVINLVIILYSKVG